MNLLAWLLAPLIGFGVALSVVSGGFLAILRGSQWAVNRHRDHRVVAEVPAP